MQDLDYMNSYGHGVLQILNIGIRARILVVIEAFEVKESCIRWRNINGWPTRNIGTWSSCIKFAIFLLSIMPSSGLLTAEAAYSNIFTNLIVQDCQMRAISGDSITKIDEIWLDEIWTQVTHEHFEVCRKTYCRRYFYYETLQYGGVTCVYSSIFMQF